MRYEHNHQRKLSPPDQPASVTPFLRDASLALLLLLPHCALPQTAAQGQRPIPTAETPAAAPPLYQRFREYRTNAVSMIYGVGEIGKPPAPAIPRDLHPLSANFSCAAPPLPDQLQPFSLFEWMTKQQAADLGILFRGPDGAERPFLGTDALVWRSGALASCLSTEGTRTVVYGWEWDVGVVVDQTSTKHGAATFTALQTQDPPAIILSFGENINGAAEQRPLLQETLARLGTDWQSDPPGHLSPKFLAHFEDARKASPVPHPETTQPIGSFVKR